MNANNKMLRKCVLGKINEKNGKAPEVPKKNW